MVTCEKLSRSTPNLFPISNFSLTKFQTKYLYFHMPKLLYFDIKGSLMQI